MTQKEYIEKRKALKEESKAIEVRIQKLRQEYTAQAPYQPGDKVRLTVRNDAYIPGVNSKHNFQICIVDEVLISTGDGAPYLYTFKKMNADGTRSNQTILPDYVLIDKYNESAD